MRAQDLLPDAVNEAAIEGVRVRKGSVAAFLANARLLVDEAAAAAARAEAEGHIAELVPALLALGLFDMLAFATRASPPSSRGHTPRP